MRGNHFLFYKSETCDLDIRPCESKSNRGLVLTKTNQHVKYESPVTSKIMIETIWSNNRPTDIQCIIVEFIIFAYTIRGFQRVTFVMNRCRTEPVSLSNRPDKILLHCHVVTLTFKVATQKLRATCRLNMVIISVK